MDLNTDQYANIMSTLATLVVGQDATNQHLKALNGKVASHEEKLTTLMLWRAEAKGFTGAINVGWTTLVTFATAIISGIGIYWIYKK